MSDMQRPMPSGTGAPRPGGAQSGVESKMSMFNPTDVAAKAAMGDIRPDMTVGEFLQKNFGVSPNDPVQKLVQATKGQLKNRNMAGKLGAGGNRPAPRPAPRRPVGPSGGAPRPQPQSGGSLDDLINKIGGGNG
jgi:hypothetical protein